jgi:hypothetical protein
VHRLVACCWRTALRRAAPPLVVTQRLQVHPGRPPRLEVQPQPVTDRLDQVEPPATAATTATVAPTSWVGHLQISTTNQTPVSLVFPPLWGVIGVVAAATAIGFLTRYAKGT